MPSQDTSDRTFPQDADLAASIAPHEVAQEFFRSSRRLSDNQRAFFLERGISDAALEADPYCKSGPIRAARVIFGQPFFDFSSEDDGDATQAFILIARDWNGVTADIAAFDETRCALWLGRAPVIGEEQVLGWRLGEPLRVFENVWSWLRGKRDGVVVLDWQVAARLLEGAQLAVDSVKFGQVLRQRLTRPAPPIFVKSPERPPYERGLRHPRGRRARVSRRGATAQRAERAGRKAADD